MILPIVALMSQPTLSHFPSADPPEMHPSTVIWSTTPAANFTESCPIGNGRLGAMVFGDPGRERVVLNESTLWSGSRYDADRPDAYKVLPEIRRLLLAGDNAKAQELVQANFVCAGPGSSTGKNGPYGCYQIFGNLEIKVPDAPYEHYRRTLDLANAVARVEYDQAGAHFTREAFVSAPAQVIVYRFTVDHPGKLSFDASMSRPENAQSFMTAAI